MDPDSRAGHAHGEKLGLATDVGAIALPFLKGLAWLRAARAGGAAAEGEVFFRTMSQSHFDELRATRKLPATAETFISPTKAFSQSYDGVLVQFNMRSGARSALESIGVRDASALSKATYGEMSLVGKGWTSNNAFFKAEGAQINIGLGKGKALETFNSYIKQFQVAQ